MDRLIVLDLDETLFHSTDVEDVDEYDFENCGFVTILRPFHYKFLDFCFSNFDAVGVWTAAGSEYAKIAMENTFYEFGFPEAHFVYTYDNCVKRRIPEPWGESKIQIFKDLSKISKFGFDLDHTLVVDDLAEAYPRQYGNLVKVKPFHGEKDDIELLKLVEYLELIKNEENYRSIEKRGWRASVELNKTSNSEES